MNNLVTLDAMEINQRIWELKRRGEKNKEREREREREREKGREKERG